jgi:LysR family pca operon transcriptional activator
MIDQRIKLRHLNALLETVRLGGVARAGEALGATQPAVSKALGELEAILGVPLFDRTRRALSLNAEGERFVGFVRGGIAMLGQAVEAIRGEGQSSVAIGALPTVSASIVPAALKQFSISPLACPVRVESGPSPYLLGLLRSGAVEVVIGRMAGAAEMNGLSFEQLYAEELAFVVRAGHPLATQGAVAARVLEGFQIVLPPVGSIIRPAIDAFMLAGGVSWLVNPVETVSNSVGRSYVLTSDAIWIVSAGAIRSEIEAGTLVALPLDVSATVGPVGITTRAGSDVSVRCASLLTEVRAAARPGPDQRRQAIT